MIYLYLSTIVCGTEQYFGSTLLGFYLFSLSTTDDLVSTGSKDVVGMRNVSTSQGVISHLDLQISVARISYLG